ncbi:hypothetical protein MTO96_006161 [Rhipicephalus appendiculatus]
MLAFHRATAIQEIYRTPPGAGPLPRPLTTDSSCATAPPLPALDPDLPWEAPCEHIHPLSNTGIVFVLWCSPRNVADTGQKFRSVFPRLHCELGAKAKNPAAIFWKFDVTNDVKSVLTCRDLGRHKETEAV